MGQGGIVIEVWHEGLPRMPMKGAYVKVFSPKGKGKFQKGRTERNGLVTFLPDRQGKWIIRVYGESEHGLHGAQIEVKVNKSLFMESSIDQQSREWLSYESEIHWIEVNKDDQWFLEFIGWALDILELAIPPDSFPNCQWCSYINSLKDI